MLIGVIGTAGRRDDGPLMSSELYTRMFHKLQELLDDTPISDRTLVSGGAAWADYLAVSMFKGELCSALHLYLPCGWDWERHKYCDTGSYDWKTNPGGTSNKYLREFSQKLGPGKDPFMGFERCLKTLDENPSKGFYKIEQGFHNRNGSVGKVDRLIAFTFGTGDVPKDGGTKNTWDNSKAPVKIHVSLRSLLS